jgi:hypothetical protein
MFILSQTYADPSAPETELDVIAQWWTKNTFPTTLEEFDVSNSFVVKNVLERGEYLEKPKDATGVIVSTKKKMAVVAGWRDNKEHDGPWQLYGEQEAETTAFHFVGDTSPVFLGWR